MNTTSRFILFTWIIFLSVMSASCTQDAVLPPPVTGLSLSVLDVSIGANLMPIVPPDPVVCRMTLVVHNGDMAESYIGLAVREGTVVVESTGSPLGTIRFTSMWDGHLAPGETDTVMVEKLAGTRAPFDPPCGARVTLRTAVVGLAGTIIPVSAEGIVFQCVY